MNRTINGSHNQSTWPPYMKHSKSTKYKFSSKVLLLYKHREVSSVIFLENFEKTKEDLNSNKIIQI